MENRRLLQSAVLLGVALLQTASTANNVAAQYPTGDAYWQADPATPGDWFDDDNWQPDVPGQGSVVSIDNLGTAVISGGHAQVRGGWIGFDNGGALRLTDGRASFEWSLSLGYAHDALGKLDVSGGKLAVSGILGVGADAGRGEVNQSAGAVTVGQLRLGNYGYDHSTQVFPSQPEAYGRGRYSMTGGTLHAAGAIIGDAGVGAFRQDGGRVTLDGILRIGGAISSYFLEIDAVLPQLPTLFDDITQPASQLADSTATAVQMAPNSLVVDAWYPPTVPSRGRYELEEGELAASRLLVDRTGRYHQTSGASEFELVAVREDGDFWLRGGSLHAEVGFSSKEPVNLRGDATLSVGAGILDLSAGIVAAGDANIVAGPGSLTILPAGFDANTGFGTFNRQGLVHIAGNDLKLPAGKQFGGAGTIEDFVDAAGEITAATNHGINLSGGMRLRAGGEVDLGAGGLAVAGRTSAFAGGSLTATRLTVGGKLNELWPSEYRYFNPFYAQLADSPGRVNHRAGTVNVAQNLGVLAGTYHISGGQLDAASIDVGVTQFGSIEDDEIHARLVQTGGVVQVGQLALAQTYFYPLLLNGITDAPGEPDSFGDAQFIGSNDALGAQLSTMHSIPGFIPIYQPELHASYRLDGGELIADAIYLSQSFTGGSSRFIQTGGAVVASRGVSMHGSDTSYIINGGSLTTRRLEIGAQYVLDNPEYVPADSATLAIRDAASDIEVRGEFLLGGGSHFRAVPGSTIRLTNPEPVEVYYLHLPASSFRNLSFDPDDLAGLNNLTLIFDGMTNAASTFEVASLDLGNVPVGFRRNFALDALHVGGDAPAMLNLVDLVDNQKNGLANEAVYVDTLVVTAGSTLDLGGLNLYYRNAVIDGNVIASAGGNLFAAVPEPTAIALAVVATLAFYAAPANEKRLVFARMPRAPRVPTV